MEKIGEIVKAVIAEASSQEELEAMLLKYGLELYIRGKTPGVIDTEDKKNYRLKRL